jgi:hypothetical protein
MWQAFKIQFTIFHPMLSTNQAVKIHGFDKGSMQMKKVHMDSPWMNQKYGQ